MAVTKLTNSGIKNGQLKYDSFLAGNGAYYPGDYYSISTITSASNTVTFSSIPQTYTHLQLRVTGRSSNGTYPSVYWTMRFNGDTGSNYDCHSVGGSGSGAFAMYNGTYTDQMIAGEIVASGGTAAQISSPIIVDILDYTNTNKYKVMRSLGGYDVNTGGNIRLLSGLWKNTAAITSISIINGDTGTFHGALYGIK